MTLVDTSDSFTLPESTDAESAGIPSELPGLVAAIAGGILILLVMSVPGLSGNSYRLDDLGAFHYPLRYFYSDCLSRGQSFDWMPAVFSGFFVSAEGQLGAYHPWHLLLYRAFPLNSAFALELLTPYPFMFAGTYLLMRQAVQRRDAAAFGSLSFTFGSFNLLHFVHPNAIAVISHIPWLLCAIGLAAHGTGRQKQTASGMIPILTASQILLGYPQYVWLSLLAEAGWACWQFRTSWSRYAQLAGFKITGLLIGGVQLIPTWEMLQDSVRSDPTTDFLMNGSWFPANLVQIFAPYLLRARTIGGNTHEFGLYFGAVPLVLTWWILFRHRAQGVRNQLRLSLAAALVVGFLLAFGRYGGLAVLQSCLPIVGSFRIPARTLVLVNFAVSILAAMALDEILMTRHNSSPQTFKSVGKLLTTGSVVLSVLLTLTVLSKAGLSKAGDQYLSSWLGLVAGPLLIATGSLICVGLTYRRNLMIPVIMLFTAVDLGFYGVSYAIFPLQAGVEKHVFPTVPTPPSGNPGQRIIADPTTFGADYGLHMGNVFVESGYIHVDGYAGLHPRPRLFAEPATIAALRAASVDWVCRSAAPKETAGLQQINDWWWKVPDPLPRIRMATKIVSSLQPSRDITAVDLHTTALTEQHRELPDGVPGVAAALEEQPSRRTIATATTSEQLLVLSERYHRGWKARVDGVESEVLRVNGDFMGCMVPAGRHVTVWNFEPASLKWGWMTTLSGLCLLALSFSGMISWEMKNSARPPHGMEESAT